MPPDATMIRPTRRRCLRAVVPFLVVVLGASACTSDLTRVGSAAEQPSSARGSSASPGSSIAPSDGTLDRFYGQQIAWGSCGDFLPDGQYSRERSQCGRLTVPVDYAKPDGATASIAMFRLRASGDRTGVLLTDPGGPGGSGVDFMGSAAGQFADLEIGKRFDIIGFDPRGVGRSTPAIRCRSDAERDRVRATDWVDTSPAGIDAVQKRNASVGAECAQKLGKEFLAHVGTADVVRDMDVMRGALRADQLNYLGYSYGTRIGAAYAEQFPTRVRAMINDGAVDPAADPVADVVAQNAGFQRAFERFAVDCASMAQCALGTDPTKVTARYQQLVRSLIGRPAKTTDPRGLTYADAITGTGQALYTRTLWRYLRDGLAQLSTGRGDTLLRLADLYEGRDRSGRYDNSADAFTAIRCVDGPAITDRAALDKLDVTLRASAPFRDDGRGSGRGAADECAYWPVPPTSTPHRIDAKGLPTTVVVSTTDDPATPYEAGVSLADQLTARLVTFKGTQHTASFEGVECLDAPLTRYLVDLTLPAVGTTC
ncbi:alpha/beta hydrolase [Williamsia sp.]|uniref:alpha/beta hydrolase n=1 Tax=Williamsia sp. TaxID=1872085 RepID=UPI0025E22019|nr:alpha/beta hydrolase [Williamsia sp.]